MTKETQQNIFDAFLQLALERHKEANVSRITLSEIAATIPMSKQALTKYHFKSIEEIIIALRKQLDDDIHSIFYHHSLTSEISPITTMVEEVLPFIYTHYKPLKVLYTTYADPAWNEFLVEHYKDWIKPYIVQTSKSLEQSDDIIASLVINNITNIIQMWLSAEFPDPPKIFEPTFLTLVRKTVNSLLDEPYQLPKEKYNYLEVGSIFKK